MYGNNNNNIKCHHCNEVMMMATMTNQAIHATTNWLHFSHQIVHIFVSFALPLPSIAVVVIYYFWLLLLLLHLSWGCAIDEDVDHVGHVLIVVATRPVCNVHIHHSETTVISNRWWMTLHLQESSFSLSVVVQCFILHDRINMCVYVRVMSDVHLPFY